MGGSNVSVAAGSRTGLLLSCLVVLAGALATAGNRAFAQEPAASCSPVVGRIVSLQGNVEVKRAGSSAWVSVRRLDTAICAGDRLRTDGLSRALMFVQPESFVRVDQNTTITLNQTTDEIEVQFFASELAETLRNTQSHGAGYFITRFPKKFKVSTPHMNAAVEGTEFMVELSPDATKLTVLEGKVSSESVATRNAQLVTAGQSLESGATGPPAIAAVVKPHDAVQWVLRYPPISDGSNASKAEELLRAGSVDEALDEINSSLSAEPGNSDAHALRAVIQIAKNDKSGALESAGRATTANDANYRAWLALSYAQQASFDLDAALESARKAQTLQPASALAHARASELYLSLGDSRRAEEAALAAIASDPGESHAHSILGFVHLARIETDAARADFAAAIERDSFSALPRLGLGLALIRDGELIAGREQLEISVALDPSNSLLRSYVGKAYYEENTRERDDLAAVQFELARQMDPLDPTPSFYDAILKYSQSRPAEALAGLESSAALNDDRAVYRSRQLLDVDLAARNASQAAVYNELGFHQLGLASAADSLAMDPGSGSAHRFLADIYAVTPRFEIARASELLQAQLRQPLGAPPLQTQLANDVLFKTTLFGPESVGFNEFNPLFVRDDVHVQLFGLLGDNDSYGDQAIVNALHGPISFSLSQFASETDGIRRNNDESVRQYDGFVQAQFGANSSAQLEVTSTDRESGSLGSSFDPTFFSPTERRNVDSEIQRVGFRQVIDIDSDLLISAIRQVREETLDIPDPVIPTTVSTDEKSWKAEAQYLTSLLGAKLVAGVSYFDGRSVLEVVNPFFSFKLPSDPRHINMYSYLQLPELRGLPKLQIGVSYDDLESDIGDQSEVNPKLGLIWNPTEEITLRAAGFRVLKRQVVSDQGLEPTQLAGFNQFFDDSNGTVSEGGGVAADFKISLAVAAGVEFTRRNLKSPFFDFDGEVFFVDQREEVASGYLYWLPERRISLSFEPRHQEHANGDNFDTMRLTELPISLRVFPASGLRLGLTVTAVEQEGVFEGPNGPAEGSDSFWLLDAIIAYRLPARLGIISLEGKNILDEEFQFQEVDQALPPRYVSESQFSLRFSLSF